MGAQTEQEALRSAVIEHAIVVITDSSGKVSFVNDKFCALSKYSREELLGNDLRILNSGYHLKEFIQGLWTTITAGKVWRGEVRNRAKDGSYYWVEMTISPRLKEDGKPAQYIAFATDITECVALRKVSAAFDAVMDTTTDRIFFKDRYSRFVRASQALVQHFGAANFDEIRGKTDLDFFDDTYALAATRDEEAIVLSDEPILNKEEKEIHSDGSVTWALTMKRPWLDKEGNVIGIMGVSKDLTELKRAQNESAQWQARFNFLLDSLPLGISWARVAENGQITLQLINDEHLRICGLTREQANQWENFRRISHPADLKIQDELNFQVASGKIDRFSLEKRYLRPDGQTVWVLFCYRLRNCGDGTFENLSCVLDITERKLAQGIGL